MLGFDGEYPVIHSKGKYWRFLVKNSKKSAVKHSKEKPILLNFCLQPFVQDCTFKSFFFKYSDQNYWGNWIQSYCASDWNWSVTEVKIRSVILSIKYICQYKLFSDIADNICWWISAAFYHDRDIKIGHSILRTTCF